MGRIAQRQIFSPSCPSGGTWYACSTDSPSQFVGCCAGTSDPCKSSCSAGNLRPASFDSAYYRYLPDVSCPSTSSPYTCPFSSPYPFFGCCKTDPCSSDTVCARSDLDAASLPSESSLAAAFSPSSTYSTSTPTSTSSSSSHSSSSSATASPSSSATATPVAAPSSSKHTKIVAGGAGGGAALLAIIVGWLFYHCLYARRSRKLKLEEFDRRRSALPSVDTAMSQIPKHESTELGPPPNPSSIYTHPRNVYSQGYATIPPISPVSASQAYAMQAPQSPTSTVSHTSRTYSVSRKDVPYSHLSQLSGDTVHEDLGSQHTSSGNWNSYPIRGSRSSPRGSRDQLSELPPVVGRRHSSEMDEGRYYTDSDGRERIRLVRSGSTAPISDQSQQWQTRY